ncbi:MAG: tRNA adenosine(34) deaminase TadA [Oscillospiraceae bacterium]|jgi:tRNA(adenine34) deaminase|nr:tRNA adenosine(34) deaminase TadA [Oscillospiraceae bacterium]
MNSNSEKYFMKIALDLARKSALEHEVPVGAVVVLKEEIVGTGRNLREKFQNSLFHAEINAINEACQNLNSWRLTGCDIFVTLEPCPMCAGAIINSRIKRLIFGADDPKSGSAGSVIDLFSVPFNHKVELIKGVLNKESSSLLKNFFDSIRKRTKKI